MVNSPYRAVVIGISAGGMTALSALFPLLPETFRLPIIVVQHLRPTKNTYRYTHFNSNCPLTVKESDEKETIKPGCIYFAPPDYHLLIERDETFSLSIDAKVNYSRPSIDVLFESAAVVWASGLIGILMTGANNDGAHGMKMIRNYGGLTIAQDPATAEFPMMPRSAIKAGAVDKILSINEIGHLLKTVSDGIYS